MNRIILNFDKTLIGIAGFQFGKTTFEKQVAPYYKKNEKNILVFPKELQTVAISFVQGFFYNLLEKDTLNTVLSEIEIEGNPNFVEKFYKVI